MLEEVEAIGYWVNMRWTKEEVRKELWENYQLIDEELTKIKNEKVRLLACSVRSNIKKI
jgi:hypothetical protein